jgi:hypothetical protein
VQSPPSSPEEGITNDGNGDSKQAAEILTAETQALLETRAFNQDFLGISVTIYVGVLRTHFDRTWKLLFLAIRLPIIPPAALVGVVRSSSTGQIC